MKKELLILVYKINVEGLTRQQSDAIIHNMINEYDLNNDEELKENYIIRQIWLPAKKSDVKVIYPIPKYTTSPEINDLVSEISTRIKNDPDNILKTHWNNLVRELKIRTLEEKNK